MNDKPNPTLLVCTHRRLGATGSCGAGGSEELSDALRLGIAARGLGWGVTETGCLGHCLHGPNLKAAPNGPILHDCRAEHSDALIERLLAGWPVKP
ncbi:MAG: (2Fe-2S) ferredoxin domain-containing protein [Rhodospirillaceae bacterium]|nr:(2Fe-2S) ferredoxin domain-containing protein [Rhodospirillales bacterium]